MTKVVIHAGDWGKCRADLVFGSLQIPKPGSWTPEMVSINDVRTVEIASEESVKRVGGTLGWGAAGALALGPVGLLAGLLLGGKGKEVTFVASFKDGRKLLATADSKVFTKLNVIAVARQGL